MSNEKQSDLTTRVRISLSVNKDLKRALDHLSDASGVPKSRLIDEAIIDLLKKRT